MLKTTLLTNRFYFKLCKKQQMAKKIFIVGNGFDLSLGLPTSYSDFLVYLVYKYQMQSLTGLVQTPLVRANFFKIPNSTYKSFKKSCLETLSNNKIENLKKIEQIESSLTKKNNFQYNSEFLKQRISDAKTKHNNNWADIERAYFDNLCLHSKSNSSQKKIDSLNLEFAEIRDNLLEYLTQIFDAETSISAEHQKFLNYHCNLMKFSNDGDESVFNQNPKDTFFINFNYSDTLRKHLIAINPELASNIIHIHGEINKPHSVIVGFGDKSCDEYQKLLHLENDQYLKFFKHQQESYEVSIKKIEFLIKPEQFQVIILGHSLTRTDHTVLEKIFKSEFLGSVKILCQNYENRQRLKTEIERRVPNFDDSKIESMNNNDIIPQRQINFDFSNVIL